MKIGDNLEAYIPSKDEAENLALLLASSIHEIKNNFGKLVFAINEVVDTLPDDDTSLSLQDRVSNEIRNISNQLSQILVLYKENQTGYVPAIEEISVSQLLRETRARHLTTADGKLQIGTECDSDLIAYLDDKFVINVLDTFIYNSLQAKATHILLSANQEKNGHVKIQIEDDGPGIPDLILEMIESKKESITPNSSSGFGLGLFFAKQVLQLHENNEDKGYMKAKNGGRLGGAVVSLYFP